MKKIPRDIDAADLIKRLNKNFGYEVSRQTGSHIRLTTEQNGEHHVTIPDHPAIKLGTLSHILNDVSTHFNKTKSQIINELF